MEVRTTARHVKVTPAVQRHLDERIQKLTRYVPELSEAHVKLSAEKHRHLAEILIHVRHEDLVAREEAPDLLDAIDGAAIRLEHQVRRLKEKKSRKLAARRNDDAGLPRSAAQVAMGLTRAAARARPAKRAPAEEPVESVDGRPRVVRARIPEGKPLSVDEAVDRLLEDRLAFLVFVDSRSERPCVLYRRRDGQLALLEARR